MKNLVLFFLLIAHALLGASNACGQRFPFAPKTSTEFNSNTYTVSGNTAREIRSSINRNRTNEYDARTTWNVQWTYTYLRDDNGVWMNDFTLTTKISMAFPELTASQRHSALLKNKWRDYMSKLRLHENGHTKTALDATRDIYLRLSLGDIEAKTPEKLTELINSECEKIIDRYRRVDLEYDRSTRHGTTQGAVFP